MLFRSDLKRAVTDPDGNFVKIVPLVDTDSPTIAISEEELDTIKHNSKSVVVANVDPDDDINLDEIENEEDSDIDPKLEKAVVIGSIVAGCILALIVIFIIFKVFVGGNREKVEATPTPAVDTEVTATPSEEPDHTTSGVQLDDLKNMDKQQAMSYLNGLNLSISIDTEDRSSDEIDEGKVITTNPVAGSTIMSGDTVTLVISTGAEKEEVPDVTSLSVNDAKKALEDKGFTTTISYDNSDTIEIEKIIGTTPMKGEQAEKGSLVTIVVSKGKATTYVKVPKLSGKTKKEAKKALEAVGLQLGNVSSNYSDSVAKNLVIAQSQSANNEVESGTLIDITLSLGPEVTYTYKGSITVSDNPFADESQSGMIKFVLEQGTSSKIVGNGETLMNYFSFPLTLDVTGWSEDEGKIIMYVDNVAYNTYGISFTKVAQ